MATANSLPVPEWTDNHSGLDGRVRDGPRLGRTASGSRRHIGSVGSHGAVPRHVEAQVRTALADTRVVAIIGPRQSGKTTLARKLARDDGRTYFTLDDDATRLFARNDPAGFLRGHDRAVIDEIQRAPGLVLAIKKIVDEDTRPGRFLITCSADLFAGAIAPDSLAGRVQTIELLPLSQAEIERRPPSSFLDAAFRGTTPRAFRQLRRTSSSASWQAAFPRRWRGRHPLAGETGSRATRSRLRSETSSRSRSSPRPT